MLSAERSRGSTGNGVRKNTHMNTQPLTCTLCTCRTRIIRIDNLCVSIDDPENVNTAATALTTRDQIINNRLTNGLPSPLGSEPVNSNEACAKSQKGQGWNPGVHLSFKLSSLRNDNKLVLKQKMGHNKM